MKRRLAPIQHELYARTRAEVMYGGEGEVFLVVETQVEKRRRHAHRLASLRVLPAESLDVLRELESEEHGGEVALTARALLLYAQGVCLREAAATVGRSGEWLSTVVDLVVENGPEAIIRRRYHRRNRKQMP